MPKNVLFSLKNCKNQQTLKTLPQWRSKREQVCASAPGRINTLLQSFKTRF